MRGTKAKGGLACGEGRAQDTSRAAAGTAQVAEPWENTPYLNIAGGALCNLK